MKNTNGYRKTSIVIANIAAYYLRTTRLYEMIAPLVLFMPWGNDQSVIYQYSYNFILFYKVVSLVPRMIQLLIEFW